MVVAVTKSIMKDCEICGRVFEVVPCRKNKAKYCSRACLGKANSLRLSGAGNPNYKEKVPCSCQACGKTFYLVPSKAKKGWGKFCSDKCRWQFWGEGNNPMSGRHPSVEAQENVRQGLLTYYKRVPIDERRRGPMSNDQKDKLRQSVLELWQDPEYREKHREGQSKSSQKMWQDPDFRESKIQSMSQSMRALWQDPEFVAKMIALWQSTEYISKLSRIHKELWQDPEYREKMLAAILKKAQDPEFILNCSRASKKMWQDPEFVKKVMVARAVKPTKPEKQLIEICGRHFPQFKYNGDFSLGITLGGLIPDFPNVNGKKDLIEIFGDYWHSPEVIGDDWKNSELGKVMVYNSLGWRCLIIWEHELKDEDKVVDKIKAFAGGKK